MSSSGNFSGGYANHQNTADSLIGSGISIPMVNPSIVHTSHVSTPEWMVMIDDLLNSTIEGTPSGTDINLTTCAELLGWFSEQARLTKGNTSNQLFSTAAIQHSSVVIAIPMGEYVASLENKMNTGSNIAAIKLIRLGNYGDAAESLKAPLQIITYTNCRLESTQQQLDKIVLSFRPETRENNIVRYGQDGLKVGNNVSFFDYTKGSIDAGA